MITLRNIYRRVLGHPESSAEYLKRMAEDFRYCERFYLKHRTIFESREK